MKRESHDILRQATKELGVKCIAADMHLSTSLVYKWCQPKEGEHGSGVENPLDRVRKLLELTGDTEILMWLCHHADGFFAHNPRIRHGNPSPLLRMTQEILGEFGALLESVSRSMNNDGRIDGTEAAAIRADWDRLKSIGESFVAACEQGVYDSPGGDATRHADHAGHGSRYGYDAGLGDRTPDQAPTAPSGEPRP